MLEIPVLLNTGEGQVSFETGVISGYLDAILLDSDDKFEIIIESAKGYLILKRLEMFGATYLSVRNKVCTNEANIFDMLTYDKYLLNEKLIITIVGKKNKDVGIIFRIT